MLAKVESLQPAGAGGLGQGHQDVVLILLVRHHGKLVLATWEEVGQSHLDILARELVEGDVLGVDDPGPLLAVPAAPAAVLGLPVAAGRAVVQQLQAQHVRLVLQHVAGRYIHDHLQYSTVQYSRLQ